MSMPIVLAINDSQKHLEKQRRDEVERKKKKNEKETGRKKRFMDVHCSKKLKKLKIKLLSLHSLKKYFLFSFFFSLSSFSSFFLFPSHFIFSLPHLLSASLGAFASCRWPKQLALTCSWPTYFRVKAC